MLERICQLVTRRPWLVIFVFVAIAVATGSRLPNAQIDPEIKNQLPRDFPARLDLDKIEKLFGGTELLMVTLVTDKKKRPAGVLAPEVLERVKLLSDRVKQLDNVDRVLSLFELKDIRNEGKAMIVDPAVKRIPRTAEEREALRADLKRNDLVFGNVVSSDFSATAIVALLSVSAEDEAILAALDRVIADTPGPGKTYVAGMPLNRKLISDGMRTDLRTFLPLGMLVMLVFLFISFRQLRGVLLPFFIVLLSIVVSMGMVPLFGWKIQMIMVMLPVIMLAIANDYGIHLVARYQEVNTPGNDLTRPQLAADVLRELARPVAITGITTMAGLACLRLHIIVPAKQMGILATLGIFYALAASLLFVPAALTLLPKAKPIVTAAAGSEAKMKLLDRLLARVASGVSAVPKTIIVLFVVASLLLGFGVTRLKVDTNTVNYFPDDNPIAIASAVADEHFGGSLTFSVGIAGDIKHPIVLRRLDALAKAIEALPQVEQTTSIAKIIRQMNEVMNGDDPAFDRIPDTREAVAQLLLMYENSGDPDDFDRIVDFGYKNALLTARINTQSTAEQSKVIHFVRRYVKEKNALWAASEVKTVATAPKKPIQPPASRPTKVEASPFTLTADKPAASQPASAAAKEPPQTRFTMVGGFAVMFNDLVDAIIWGQLSSLGLSLLLVVIIVAALFRSVVAGLLSGGTLGLAMAILFGLMGLMGIELNLPTAMLSSIMIGVGVDYTIHFLWRYRSERRAGLEPQQAVIRTLTTSGRGIIINALSVIVGFAVMFFSSFVPVQHLAFLVVVSITACLLGAMLLMPALVMIVRPKFLEPKDLPGGDL